MPRVTPEERAAIEIRLAALKIRMESLDHINDPDHVAEWAALYEVREGLDKLLGDDI